MHQPADLGCRGRQLTGADNHVGGFRCSQMMADWADSAQALYQYRQFPVGSALDEFLKAAELGDMQTCLPDIAVFSLQQGNLAMAFYAGQRLDDDAFQFLGSLGCFQW